MAERGRQATGRTTGEVALSAPRHGRRNARVAFAAHARAAFTVAACAALSLATFASIALAGAESAGTRAASFLSIGTGASLMGMGGAGLGLGGGLQGAAWNVAALGRLAETEVSLAHVGLPDESLQEWAAVGGRVKGGPLRWGTFGVYRANGSYEVRDASNRLLGSEEARNMALGYQLALPIGERLLVGAGVKYVGEHFGAVHGNGGAFDLGAQARFGVLGLGIAAQNFGGGLRYAGGERWRMPSSLGLGVALDHAASGLRLALDFELPSSYYRTMRTGFEWRWRDALALRAGLREELGAPSDERLGGPTFGLGAGARGLWVDYGFIPGSDQDSQHRIALSLRPARAGLTGASALGAKAQPESGSPPGSDTPMPR